MKNPFRQFSKKKGLIKGLAGIAILVCITIAAVIIAGIDHQEEASYQEAQVLKGELAIGVSETGSVDVGTATQSFDLDISEFSGESSFDAQSNFNMGGMMSFGEENSSSTSTGTRQLIVEEVYVEAGEEVAEGTAILKITEESVNSIRRLLEEDVASAEIVYQQTLTIQKQTAQEAGALLKINTLYGSYAQSEYQQSLDSLQEEAEAKQENLTKAEETLAEAQDELIEKQTLLAEEKQVLANAVYTAEGTDREEALYWWIIAYQTQVEAQNLVDTLEEEIEELTEKIPEYAGEVQAAQIQLELANKELEKGQIEAKIQMDSRNFSYENAQEIYDVSIEQSEFDTENALADFEDAKNKLSEFDSVIVDQIIYTEYNGLITDVSIASGDTLTQNMDLISMNDYNEVTITLSVEEEDMEAAALGNPVHISLAAFPDEIFKGEVTEIGDAEIDSNTNKTLYSVTVTITNTDTLLYQDMTADVTFVTEETAEVLYVSNKAIQREGDNTCVIVRDQDGKIAVRQVTTGFTDGINTEIKEGLSEGETVLIERKG